MLLRVALLGDRTLDGIEGGEAFWCAFPVEGMVDAVDDGWTDTLDS
jgi:hypothetical protein